MGLAILSALEKNTNFDWETCLGKRLAPEVARLRMGPPQTEGSHRLAGPAAGNTGQAKTFFTKEVREPTMRQA